MAVQRNFFQDVLQRLGIQPDPGDLELFDAWARAEGTKARFNPLATTRNAPGASSFNSVGVRNFPDYQTGVRMTAETIGLPYYRDIVRLLRQPRTNPTQVAQAIAASPWGTGQGVLNVLGAGGGDDYTSPGLAGATTPAAPPAAAAVTPTMPRIKNPRVAKQAKQALTRALMQAASGGDAREAWAALMRGVQLTGQIQYEQAPTPTPTVPTQTETPAATIAPGATTNLPADAKGAQLMVTVLDLAKRMGLKTQENPYVDPTMSDSHVPGSFHYQNFPGSYNGRTVGRGVDIYGPPEQMRALTELVYKRYKPRVAELFYDPWGQWDTGRYSPQGIGNHGEHVHVSI